MSLKRIYRTLDGKTDYTFNFSTRPFSQTIRVYIIDAPSYGNRATDGHSTHRFFDPNQRPYICFDPQPTNMTDAFNIAKAWAEKTQRYIHFGESF